MADKYYIYDSEGRRALEGKELLDYYNENRDYYVQLAHDLYRTVLVPGGELPLRGDIFVMMFGALKANPTFIETLLDHEVNLERAVNKWFNYFAWVVVLDNWNKISR